MRALWATSQLAPCCVLSAYFGRGGAIPRSASRPGPSGCGAVGWPRVFVRGVMRGEGLRGLAVSVRIGGGVAMLRRGSRAGPCPKSSGIADGLERRSGAQIVGGSRAGQGEYSASSSKCWPDR